MLYFAIIGDFISSKRLENRNDAQKKLKTCLDSVNQNYKELLASQFSITLGDEFQGLLLPEAPIFQLIDDINQSLVDYKIRFGIGLGEIVTDINPEQSIGADGPAYWYAREAITYIHQKNDYGNTQVAIRLADKEKAQILNTLLAAGEAIKSNWRSSQLSLLSGLLSMGIYDENFEKGQLAELLQLNSSALSKRLKSSNLKVYLRSRKTALEILREIKEEEDK